MLLETSQIRKMISSYVGENKLFAKQYLAGELEIEFNPQGTLAERIRAGGAGIPAFFTRPGSAPTSPRARKSAMFDGEHYVMEPACSPISRSSTPGRAIPKATSSIARPRETSIR